MAKVPKVKKRAVSVHSRAARREASPSLDLDKSLKNVKPPTSTLTHPLKSQDAGIRKRKQKQKPLRRAQRLRQLRGMERAAVVQDQLEKKVETSMDKLRTVKTRRKNWDDLNKKLGSSSRFAALADGFDEKEADQQGHWEDVEEGTHNMEIGDAEVQKSHTPVPISPLVAETPVNEEDEIS